MSAKENIIKVLNCFETGKAETDYSSIFLYRDGPNKTKQVTLGRGYVESGSLWTVFEHYQKLGGATASKLLSYKKDKGKQTLPNNKEFLNLIVSAGKNDPLFRQAQDSVYDLLYWKKGADYCATNGFETNLGMAVIQDSFLHSGSMMGFLVNSFAERRPANGGNEKIWLYNKGGLLRNTVYRMDFMLKEINKENWDFNTPLVANGVKIN
jgi:chitosanase